MLAMSHKLAMTPAFAVLAMLAAACTSSEAAGPAAPPPTAPFELLEASIADIQAALLARELTAVELVERYLQRIRAYNGTCVNEPEGILGPVMPIANAGQINALTTLNLRPAAREAFGFDPRKARSMTDAVDDDPNMPDALEVAAALDAALAATGELVGPLHGGVIAIKDQYDTFDMRTTSGADAFYANDRPPDDATFVKRLREAGAIVLAKANMGEYAAGMRSSFGGTLCNPYDTERSPGGSSGGSGSAVAANLVTCAIAEESGPSVRSPAKNNNVVGLSPTQELVSRDGMIPASFMNDRVGPICRNVQDTARLFDAIAGYDPKDELTALGTGFMPAVPYAEAARPGRLDGIRIGVLREYMDKSLFTAADAESIDVVERALPALAALGAEIVDPGAGGALFQACLAKHGPHVQQARFVAQHGDLFPPGADHVPLLVELFFDSSRFPNGPSIRDLGQARTVGDRRYMLNRYLAERGDANIKSIDDLLAKSNFYQPAVGFQDKKETLTERNVEKTLDVSARLDLRFAVRQIVMQCMSEQNLDALTYPTSNIPAPKLGAPNEPNVNGRPSNAWSLLGQQGFPAITVPAGFTTEVYDRIPDASAPAGGSGETPTKLVGPVAARLPVGIDFLTRPFGEPLLLRIAAAYEDATKHREAPQGFGALHGGP
jgi:Asp-tRNA(Asn)/Glu-tRNA(Gln) amidotransferase A subunit family amidase